MYIRGRGTPALKRGPKWEIFDTKKLTTVTRFELARAEPSRFLIYLLNHSDTLSVVPIA